MIAIVLSGLGLIHDVPYTGPRGIDLGGAALSVVGMGGVVIGILVWQEGGEYVGLLIAVGVASLAGLAAWLTRRKRGGPLDAAGPRAVRVRPLPPRHRGANAAEHHAGRGDDRAPHLPADGAGVQRARDRPDARAAVGDDVLDRAGRRQARRAPAAEQPHPRRLRAGDDRDAAARRRSCRERAPAGRWSCRS